ncbi:hypothetical protein HK098_006488 [Nowakowskiella sp. JEL0407]|nr:hypothetical protein HK098_006488 [Nowakowskiella sp. JEL0407]
MGRESKPKKSESGELVIDYVPKKSEIENMNIKTDQNTVLLGFYYEIQRLIIELKDGEYKEIASEETNPATNGAPTATIVRHGNGKYECAVTKREYIGNWENDRMFGKGMIKFPNGSSYEGEIFAQGNFVSNKYHGVGTYRWADGTTYTGEFEENEMQGTGKYKDGQDQSWIGQFTRGSESVTGVSTWQGDYYYLDSSYDEFAALFNAHILNLAPNSNNLSAIWDDQGLLALASEFCKEKMKYFESCGEDAEASVWSLERNCWELVLSLLGSRLTQLPPTEINPTSDRSIASSLIASDRTLVDLDVVKAWLQNCSRVSQRNGVDQQAGFRKATMRKRGGYNIVDSVDPDSCVREKKGLDGADLTHETHLNKAIFEYIRCGNKQAAIDLCVKSQQHWKAASINGGEYSIDLDTEDEARNSGNPNRDVWRAVCYEIAKQDAGDMYERALYAILAGDVENALPVCETWEDHVWVHFSALLERELNKRLAMVDHRHEAHEVLDLEVPVYNLNPADVFDQLVLSPITELKNSALLPFHSIQARIILNQVDTLFYGLGKLIEKGNSGEKVERIPNFPHILRFIVHFGLSLKIGGYPIAQYNLDYLIKTYIDLLIAAKKYQLVAIYTMHLPVDLQTETENLSNQVDINESNKVRYEYLLQARNQGLDVHAISRRTVEAIFERGILQEPLPEYPDNKKGKKRQNGNGIVDSGLMRINEVKISSVKEKVDDTDMEMINGMEWVMFEKEQYVDTLKMANLLLRRLLVQGRVHSAAAAVEKLPKDMISREWRALASDDENVRDPRMREIVYGVREYATYENLVRCIAEYERWKRGEKQDQEAMETRFYSMIMAGFEIEETEEQESARSVPAGTRDVVAFDVPRAQQAAAPGEHRE